MNSTSRAGHFVQQLTGYTAFVPAILPPHPPIRIEGNLARMLSAADVALGRLDGITGILPNPDLFVAMYVKQEAVLSSQIEGTQASLTDVLQFEVGDDESVHPRDVQEVVNYVGAMNYGLEQTALPLSLRLIREIHGRLMQGVRGEHCEPGEFRRTQNWIGPGGCTLSTAAYVPPPPDILQDLLGNLEKFLHDDSLPPLINAGLAHAQFETIHPFLDGNGRVGRLLITFLLCQRGILSRPLLYLSHFLKQNRSDYYDHLQAIRVHGRWEEWLTFFLRGVAEVATEAHETARKILQLRTQCQELLQGEGKAGATLLRVLDILFEQPLLTPAFIEKKLGVTYVTANNHVTRLQDLGLLKELTGYKRNRRFAFSPYLVLFKSASKPSPEPSVQWIRLEELQVPDAPQSKLTPEQIQRVATVQKVFAEIDATPLEDWTRDFERDRNPEREIAIYEAMAQAYTAFCARHALSRDARLEVFSLLLIRSGSSNEDALARTPLKHLNRKMARQILKLYSMPPKPLHVVAQ